MDVIKELEELRRTHFTCEDCWYSCPKSKDGCCNDWEGDECNCGADKENEILDNIIKHLKDNQEIQRIENR